MAAGVALAQLDSHPVFLFLKQVDVPALDAYSSA